MKILEILNLDKKSREEKETLRVAKALKRNQEALVDKYDKEVDDAQAKVDKLLLITPETVNTASWNQDFHNALLDVEASQVNLDTAKETLETYFTDSKKK